MSHSEPMWLESSRAPGGKASESWSQAHGACEAQHSKCLILCHPLLLLPPIHPSIRVFSNESTLHEVRAPVCLSQQGSRWVSGKGGARLSRKV